jgi:hypothetical protein
VSKTARSISLEDEDWQAIETYGQAFGQSPSQAIASIVRQPQVYMDWVDQQKATATDVIRR